MYWISYYLDRGHDLDYLLNLNYSEKLFFIESLKFNSELKAKYDIEKIKASNGV